jgi:hypothetical protein
MIRSFHIVASPYPTPGNGRTIGRGPVVVVNYLYIYIYIEIECWELDGPVLSKRYCDMEAVLKFFIVDNGLDDGSFKTKVHEWTDGLLNDPALSLAEFEKELWEVERVRFPGWTTGSYVSDIQAKEWVERHPTDKSYQTPYNV